MTGNIGVARGTALCIGAVLGLGVLVLPALAVRAAGPAAVAALAVAVIVAMSGAFLFAPAAVAVVVQARLFGDPGPAAAMRAAAWGIDRRAPLGDVRARGTAGRVGIR